MTKPIKLQHYVLEAIATLQSVADCLSQSVKDNAEFKVDAFDLHYVTGTLSEMAMEYGELVHNLEMACLDRVKYYENAPNMVCQFRRHIQTLVPHCQAASLRKLEDAMNTVKGVSQILSQLQTHRRRLRDDNERLTRLVEQVAKETEQIMETVLAYYNRRSQNEDALAVAFQSVTATEERVSLVENNMSLELDDWEEEELYMRMKEYELALNLCLEKDEIMWEEDAANEFDKEESSLRDALALLDHEMQDLRHGYDINMIVLRAQNKIHEAVIGKTLAERMARVADVERWALRIESPLLYLESEEDLGVLEEDEDRNEAYETDETACTGKPPEMATEEDIKLLFTPAVGEEQTEMKGIFNKEEWEGILGSFETVDQLQTKIKTLLITEKHMNDETQKIKRQLAARTRKLDKLKKDLISLNNEIARLQEGCDAFYNTLRDLEEQDESLRDRSIKELHQMHITTTEEIDQTKSLKEELRLLEYQLNDYILVSSLEMDDLADAITDQHEAEEEIKLNATLEFERHTLMLAQIECGRIEWQLQEALRKEIAGEYAYFVEQLRIFKLESQRITAFLQHAELLFEGLYWFYTARFGDMAVECANLRHCLEDAKARVKLWRAKIAEVRLMNEEEQKYLASQLQPLSEE
ncbi:hypothetical protein BV898_10618 [Hypsibius exemplaris]|uniref:Uncharacterized protein n=1 Tax=Hypsibius exemplaris TaxID=2072580 RepID=A0A1W0WJ63_HYPEX|nr:hypothetical protein BV898_10618 [Hypsibius exemplaris]